MDVSVIETIDQEKFGGLVRKRMKERELRYDQICTDLGYPRSILRMVLSGKRRIPHSRLNELINYFGFSEDELPLKGKKSTVPNSWFT